MCILHIVFCTVCKYVLSICKLLLLFFCTVWSTVNAPVQFYCTVCPYVHCLLFFCTVCPYVHCLLFFLHCLSICTLFVVFLHCLSICKFFVVVFCTVWSTLIRISLTKALVLWWCDNKSDLIWIWIWIIHYRLVFLATRYNTIKTP